MTLESTHNWASDTRLSSILRMRPFLAMKLRSVITFRGLWALLITYGESQNAHTCTLTRSRTHFIASASTPFTRLASNEYETDSKDLPHTHTRAHTQVFNGRVPFTDGH